jgi:hypothetical protein
MRLVAKSAFTCKPDDLVKKKVQLWQKPDYHFRILRNSDEKLLGGL